MKGISLDSCHSYRPCLVTRIGLATCIIYCMYDEILLLFFAKATVKAARRISTLLALFASTTGQRISFRKSTFLFSKNVSNACRQQLVQFLQIQHKVTLERHLGINNILKWRTLLIPRISWTAQRKFSSWKGNLLQLLLQIRPLFPSFPQISSNIAGNLSR